MAKSSAKSGGSKSASRSKRRADLRRTVPKPAFEMMDIVRRPEIVRATLVLAVFTLLISTIVVWSREQVPVRIGQIMTDTRVKRLDYQEPDDAATQEKREEATKSAPRVYRLNDSYLSRIEASLLGLPRAVADKTETAQISDELLDEFQLTAAGLAALQAYVTDGEAPPQWRRWVDCLIKDQLRRYPLIDSVEYQKYAVTLNRALLMPDGSLRSIRGDAIELRDDPDARAALELRLFDLVVRRCNVPEDVAIFVVARLSQEPSSTIVADEELTRRLGEQAAAEVVPVMIDHHAGDPLFRRSDVLSTDQQHAVQEEARQYWLQASAQDIWVPRLGVVGLCAILVVLLGAFAAINYPRLLENSLRLTTLCVVMAGMLVLATTITVRAPHFLYGVTIATTLFVAVIMLLAYDRRLALVVAATQCVLVTISLEQSIGWFVLLMAGCMAFVGQLREVRHRNSMIRAATLTAVVLSVGAVVLGLFETPLVEGVGQVISFNAGSAAAASFGVGFLILGILPSIERLFDITTGMTLAELRDPKQPLLRQLQQRAPGTYNHSLQVANICEAAAEAIGADGLLLYVGALYHDIGKLNRSSRPP
ncbi:MAG: HDIG domain-containing metalloprotein [Planctomycetota bacterium]|jgi:membrane-associated HD superfamily phosphohydrolase